jgi:hypothetical protein
LTLQIFIGLATINIPVFILHFLIRVTAANPRSVLSLLRLDFSLNSKYILDPNDSPERFMIS